MIKKEEPASKWRIYAAIIAAVFAVNMLLNVVTIALNYPTESHRSVARQLDVFSVNMMSGQDFTTIMDSDEYKKVAQSSEAKYMDAATMYLLALSLIVTVTIIGTVYYYLRKHRTTAKPVGATVLLVTIGGLLPLILSAYMATMYIGLQMPGIGHVVFMLFIGLVIAPLVNAVITRIFDWHYNRKHSFVIE
jgi:hypothetical protein